MRINVVCEGHSDRAVIFNIIQGITNLDDSDIRPVLPIYAVDETDKAHQKNEQFGGWSSVKKECEQKNFIDEYLLLDDNYIVIHIDSAEALDYGVEKPNNKVISYATIVVDLIKTEIQRWLSYGDDSRILFAIAVEETDAWILVIEEDRDSSKIKNPKKHLEYIKGFKVGKMTPNYNLYKEYSLPFNISPKDKKGVLEKRMTLFSSRNSSLLSFVNEIKTKLFDADGILLK